MQALTLAPAGSAATRFQPRPLPYPAGLSPLVSRSQFAFNVEGIPVQGLLTAPVADGPYPTTILRWRFGSATADLALPGWLTARVLRAIEPGLDGEVGGMTTALLLEMALAEPLARLEAACGGSLELVDEKRPAAASGPADENDIVLGIAGLFDGEPFAGAIHAPMQAMVVLQRLAASPPAAAVPVEPPIAIAVRLGLARLEATLLRSLEAGDAILLEQPPDAAVVIVAGERLTATGRLDGRRVILDAPLQPATRTAMEIWLMTENAGPDAPHPESLAPPETPLHDLQVTLVFELARQAATLRDVQSLAPGHVIELGPLAERHVSVLANGAKIGEGEIVRVGDATAVRLTRLAAG